MITKIINARIVCVDGILEDQSLYVEDGVIKAVTKESLPYENVIDAEGNYLSAGFIDLHVHGGMDYDFMDGTEEAVVTAANFHCKHGTTTICPTVSAASYETTVESLEGVRKAVNSGKMIPSFGGVHLEGPYFSLNQCGAQNADYITPPIPEDYERILAKYKDVLKRWSFAPELAGTETFMKALTKYDIVTSLAHTDAKYDDVMLAYREGCRLITHFFSCISSITRDKGFRILGVMECGYLLQDMMVEAIADGCHIPRELFRMLYQIKGSDRMCLVTDAIRCAGSDKEVSVSGGIPIKVKDGVARLMDESAFAGSIATTDRLVRFCTKEVGIDLCETIKMITVNPAKVMKLEKKGKIEAGYDADFVIFDEDIQIKKVFVAGEEV